MSSCYPKTPDYRCEADEAWLYPSENAKYAERLVESRTGDLPVGVPLAGGNAPPPSA